MHNEELNGTAGTGETPDQPLSQADQDTAKLQRELEDYKDKFLRAAADMENIRRRLEREKAELVKYSNENLLRDLIPLLDSIDKALPTSSDQEANPSAASLKEGFVMMHRQLTSVLGKYGLEEIKAAGQPFDPNLHQAIQRVESKDVDLELVQQEFAKGYTLHGRLLRPSMVSVLVPDSAN